MVYCNCCVSRKAVSHAVFKVFDRETISIVYADTGNQTTYNLITFSVGYLISLFNGHVSLYKLRAFLAEFTVCKVCRHILHLVVVVSRVSGWVGRSRYFLYLIGSVFQQVECDFSSQQYPLPSQDVVPTLRDPLPPKGVVPILCDPLPPQGVVPILHDPLLPQDVVPTLHVCASSLCPSGTSLVYNWESMLMKGTTLEITTYVKSRCLEPG